MLERWKYPLSEVGNAALLITKSPYFMYASLQLNSIMLKR